MDSEAIRILQRRFKPDEKLQGLVCADYWCTAHWLFDEFPNLTLTGIVKDEKVEPGLCSKLVNFTDIPKYDFLGMSTLPELDFAIMNGFRGGVRIWASIKLGGVALGLDCNPIRFKGLKQDGWWIRKKKRWIVVSGCHRGGTLYASRVLNAAGLRIGHQGYWPDGISSGAQVCCSHPEGSYIIHQIRNPIPSIESLQGAMASILRTFLICPLRGLKEPPLLLAMKYWLWIHTIAKIRGLWTYKVEDMESRWPEICERLEIDAPFPDVPKDTNKRTYQVPSIKWSNLYEQDEYIAEMIRVIALEHEYV